ncbi:MutS domain III [Filimonas lacunae]|uniref:MutS domain III n=1 Tax=Filimonas lacunae TaxID=477680 RepID=A0A173MS17_9BACT|nr:DNA mismatch repair protein MutS [Filimonas lacunae]BAV10316.1 MutS-related protein, family 1 [Filimonas lacunae]SIT17160.1 MutS domain III [Filimonas lacunae]
MQADKTTLSDLSIFHAEEEQSVFHHIDFARTIGGRDMLRHLLGSPLSNLAEIRGTQQVLQLIISVHAQWPEQISNGTVMVVGRFYETAVSDIPSNPNAFSALMYKLMNGADYSAIRYSVTHCIDFVQGLQSTARLLYQPDAPPILEQHITRIARLLEHPVIRAMLQEIPKQPLAPHKVLEYGRFLRLHYKQQLYELLDIYYLMDAWYGMATACKTHQLQFPEFVEQEQPLLKASELYHPLLQTPVAYSVGLTPEKNFLFLTGANMGGKSTFIKAVGVAVYLAHAGMGVPAQSMQLTMFHGLLSNIQMADNIIKGESYFYNEVQRIRKTIEKINDGKKWLILIDELFKGTNVQDAMKCSTAVIEGLRKMKNALFILSTHLYEIGESLQQYPNIQFRYFETSIHNEQLVFSYQLKEGVSNDRLGYLILKKEGIVEMLERL